MSRSPQSQHHTNWKPIDKGQPIMEWLYAGPYELDVSELYHDNYNVPIEPYQSFIQEAMQQFAPLLKEPPVEGQEQQLFGQQSQWRLHRAQPTDKKVTWARFGIYARLMSVFASNQLYSEREQTVMCRLAYTGSIVVAINGKPVFESWRAGRESGKQQFELQLKPGVNHCQLLLLNVHLHCANSFTIVLEAESLQSSLLLLGSNQEEREQIERELASFYLERTRVEISQAIELLTDEPMRSSGRFLLSLTDGNGLIGSKQVPAAAGTCRIELGDTRDLKPWNAYTVNIDYETLAGSRIPGVKLGFSIPKYWGQVPTLAYTERKRYMLQQYAAYDGSNDKIRVIHTELAKLLWMTLQGNDQEFPTDFAAIEQGIEFINGRYDCADFALHGLLRLYALYKDSPQLPSELKKKMKLCILGFKYGSDEPGKSMMFTRSENHEMLFYSAEYLAGLMFPTETFANSEQNGLFHALKGRWNAERWIKEKGTYGFMEWHSNTYYEEDMLSLLNIYDFGEENSFIRHLARNLLDSICFMIASHSYQGVLGTTHGRSYEEMIMHPEQESMSHLNWLMFGQPNKLIDKCSIGAVALCSSKYRPDLRLEEVASSDEELFTKTRMGLFPNEGLGGVNCATYRTKDYMVSGLVESRKGRFGSQTHAGQALLDGLVPIFVTCFDNNSETTRPSYWGGNYVIPKTIVCKNVLAYIFRIDDVLGYTHCYFPRAQMEECLDAGGWLFGRSGEAYIAVYSSKPYKVTRKGTYKDRELLCPAKSNIWLLQLGSRSEYGSFHGFVEAVTAAELSLNGEDLTYVSPSQGKLELSWENTCTLDGKPIMSQPYPLIENRYANAAYGSGLTYLNLAGQEKILNFRL